VGRVRLTPCKTGRTAVHCGMSIAALDFTSPHLCHPSVSVTPCAAFRYLPWGRAKVRWRTLPTALCAAVRHVAPRRSAHGAVASRTKTNCPPLRGKRSNQPLEHSQPRRTCERGPRCSHGEVVESSALTNAGPGITRDGSHAALAFDICPIQERTLALHADPGFRTFGDLPVCSLMRPGRGVFLQRHGTSILLVLDDACVHAVAERVQTRALPTRTSEWIEIGEHRARIEEWLGKRRPLRLWRIHTLLVLDSGLKARADGRLTRLPGPMTLQHAWSLGAANCSDFRLVPLVLQRTACWQAE
jgi:hypothetical protein